MKKIYVQDYLVKNVDGEKLQVVKTYESKPRRFDYIFWLDNKCHDHKGDNIK